MCRPSCLATVLAALLLASCSSSHDDLYFSDNAAFRGIQTHEKYLRRLSSESPLVVDMQDAEFALTGHELASGTGRAIVYRSELRHRFRSDSNSFESLTVWIPKTLGDAGVIRLEDQKDVIAFYSTGLLSFKAGFFGYARKGVVTYQSIDRDRLNVKMNLSIFLDDPYTVDRTAARWVEFNREFVLSRKTLQ